VHVLGVRDRLLEELPHVVVVEVVHDAASVAGARDEAEMAKQTQLVGDRRGLHADRLGQGIHRRRARVEAAEYAAAARRGERLHRVGDDAGEREVEVGRVMVDAAMGHIASIAEEPFRYSVDHRR